MQFFQLNIPTVLTFLRLIASVLILPILLVNFLPYNNFQINFFLALLFSIISVTDFLDGYLARKYNQETIIGKVLDPIADKFLLLSTLVSLVYVQKIYFYIAIILIAREFFISGLREASSFTNIYIKVSNLGKLKTFLQSIYIILAILNTEYNFLKFNLINSLEIIFLSLSIIISIFSAIDYYKNFIKSYYLKLR